MRRGSWQPRWPLLPEDPSPQWPSGLRDSSASEPWFASALWPAGPRPGCSSKAELGLREGDQDPHGPAGACEKPPSGGGSHKSSTDRRKWRLCLNSAVVLCLPPAKEDASLSPDSVPVHLVSTVINNGDRSQREIPSVSRSNAHWQRAEKPWGDITTPE